MTSTFFQFLIKAFSPALLPPGPEVQASAGEMAELERERRQVEEDLQIQELESPAEELDFQLVNGWT